MGKNARLRKLRREARRAGLDTTLAGFASTYQQQHPDAILRVGQGAEKMSEVLELFAEPLLASARSKEDVETALSLAALAWNSSLLEDTVSLEQDPVGSAFLADPTARIIFEALLARKEALYPENKRIILDYQVISSGAGFRFNVISTPG